jgi:protein-L-isoaspartate(D-aspartate) O-methyltransferase
VEIFPDLAERAAANLQSAAANNVVVEVADALKLSEADCYDVIAVTGSLPLMGPLAQDRFARALRVGGRLVVCVGQVPVMQVLKITRVSQDEWRSEELFETVIPALVNAERPSSFVF